MKNTINIIVDENEEGDRVDLFLAKKYRDYSRSYFNDLIKNNDVLLNEKSVKSSTKVKTNDTVSINFIETKKPDDRLIPEDIPLNIIYEDEDVLVVNKQPGLVVHPAAGNTQGTLVNALINYFPKIQDAVIEKGNAMSESRPGLVHRLDKDTSGVIIIAKNPRSMHSLSQHIQHRNVKKYYFALCYNWPKNPTGHLVNYLGRNPKDRKMVAEVSQQKGKEAISDYEVAEYFKTAKGENVSLIKFDIKTGRTHQIRVQAQRINCPVLGDQVYGNKESMKLSESLHIERQMLHAYQLCIPLIGEPEKKCFTAELPKDFLAAEENLIKMISHIR
jgi:23S rRNA pseudouridine1911/1915/1917 synthase